MGVGPWRQVDIINHLKFASNEALEGSFRDKNKRLRERSSAFRQRGARLGIQIVIQKMKISSTPKTCDLSDVGKPYMLWTDQKSKRGEWNKHSAILKWTPSLNHDSRSVQIKRLCVKYDTLGNLQYWAAWLIEGIRTISQPRHCFWIKRPTTIYWGSPCWSCC